MAVTVIAALLAPLYNWLLVFRLRLGVLGAAYAYIASGATSTAAMLTYVVWRDVGMARRGAPNRTWHGLTREAWRGWGTYLSYGLPAAAMICVEWWSFEIVIFLAGTRSLFVCFVCVWGGGARFAPLPRT